MKSLLTTIACFAAFTATAQITLEHTYQNSAINFASYGEVGYTSFNATTATWKMYTPAHQEALSINIPSVNGISPVQTPTYYGTNLFTASGSFEYLMTYNSPTESHVRVFNESGQAVFSKTYPGLAAVYALVGSVGGDPKLIVRAGAASEVYALSGEWPFSSVGIVDHGGISGFNMYPNPSTDMVTLELPEPGTIDLINMHGQTIHTVAVDQSGSVSIPVASIAPGVYVVQINGQLSERLIIR